MKRRNLVTNFHIHVSVSDLYIPTIGPRQTDRGNYISLTDTWMWKLGDKHYHDSGLEIRRPLSFISGKT